MKHIAVVLLSCFLCACAGSTPTQYARGTLTAPPPAPTRPGVGLPALGDPGTQAKHYPRGTDRRVLPQTPETRKEDGIWASRPQPGSGGFVEVLEELVPAPREDDENYKNERQHAEMCASKVNNQVRAGMGDAYIAKMDEQVRACLARELMSECLSRMHDRLVARGPHRTRPPNAVRAQVIAESDKDKVCTEKIMPFVRVELNTLERAGVRQW